MSWVPYVTMVLPTLLCLFDLVVSLLSSIYYYASIQFDVISDDALFWQKKQDLFCSRSSSLSFDSQAQFLFLSFHVGVSDKKFLLYLILEI